MKPRWTKGLAAFDRDVAKVPTRLQQYERFVAATLRGLNRGLKRADPEVDPLDLDDREDLEGTPFGGRWVAVGEGDEGLDIVVWPSAPWGGVPGVFVVGLFLDPSFALEEELAEDLAVAAAAAREATGSSPADAVVDPRSRRGTGHSVAYVTVPIDGAGLVDRLVEVTRRFDRALPAVQHALAARRARSSLRWVREQLLDRDDDLASVAPGTRVDATMAWLGRALPTSLQVWGARVARLLFEAHEPAGRLTFRDERRTSRRHVQSVCEAIGRPYAKVDGFHGGVLLDDDEARRLHGEGKADEVHARIRDTWAAHVARSGRR